MVFSRTYWVSTCAWQALKKKSRIADEILIQSAKLEKGKEYHMPKGTIVRLMDSAFGFIKTEEGGNLFFHRNDLEGVEFEEGQGRDGRPQLHHWIWQSEN